MSPSGSKGTARSSGSSGSCTSPSRLTTSNATSCTCMGCASAVVLTNSQTSVDPTAGFSVTASSHSCSTGTPPSAVPSSASTGPSTGSPFASNPMPDLSMSTSGRVTDSGGSGVIGGQHEELRRRRRVGRGRGDDAELAAPARSSRGRRRREVDAGDAAAERLVGPDIAAARGSPTGTFAKSTMTSARSAEPQQEAAAVVGRHVHRRSEEAALVADLPGLDARDAGEVEDQEPRLAAVQEAEPVPALLDDLERPRGAVRDEHVAEELRVPDRGELAGGDVVGDDAVEERPGVGVEQRAVVVERAVLHGDRDLVVGLVRRELVVRLRRGPGEHGRRAGAAVEHGLRRPRGRRG